MIVQCYNSRSKKWVLLDDEKKGGIQKMQAEKFPGVPVKGEKVSAGAGEDVEDFKNVPVEDVEPVEDQDQEEIQEPKNTDNKKSGWLAFFDL